MASMRNGLSIRSSDSWDWLRKGTLKKETEGTIIADQDQALGRKSLRTE